MIPNFEREIGWEVIQGNGKNEIVEPNQIYHKKIFSGFLKNRSPSKWRNIIHKSRKLDIGSRFLGQEEKELEAKTVYKMSSRFLLKIYIIYFKIVALPFSL